MKIKKICEQSGINCDDFTYHGNNKHLPVLLKYHPQHILYDSKDVKLCYFKPSYDNIYLEIWRNELVSLRRWSANIEKVHVFVFNYTLKQYTVFEINSINNLIYSCRREKNSYLLSNQSFKWRKEHEPFTL